MQVLIDQVIMKYPIASLILAGIGSLLLIAQIVVAFTPSKKDDIVLDKVMSDSFFGKIYSFFVSFAPIQKGGKGLEMSSTTLQGK
jgi:hypothetical protein